MRVAFLTNSVNLYGSNRSLLDLIDGLRDFAMEPHVILPTTGAMVEALTQRNIPLAILPIQNWVYNCVHNSGSPIIRAAKYAKRRGSAFSRLAQNMAILPKVVKQLRLWNIDIIHTNSVVTPVGAMAARITGRPHIWHIREFVDGPNAAFCADWGVESIRYFIARANAQIAISECVRSHYFGAMNGERTHVMYNCIATLAQFDQWKKMASYQRDAGESKPNTFSILGRISPNKGQEIAIEALALVAKSHPRVRLLVVGGGNNASLKALASSLGVLENIEFWGYTDDPYQAYFSSDAVLVCSKSEGMGRVAAEAMSTCLPVIGLNRTATPEIVRHGHTGLLFNGDPRELADCMRQFIENPTWARELGMNGWQIAREQFNSELYAQRIYKVLEQVMSQSLGHDERLSHTPINSHE